MFQTNYYPMLMNDRFTFFNHYHHNSKLWGTDVWCRMRFHIWTNPENEQKQNHGYPTESSCRNVDELSILLSSSPPSERITTFIPYGRSLQLALSAFFIIASTISREVSRNSHFLGLVGETFINVSLIWLLMLLQVVLTVFKDGE